MRRTWVLDNMKHELINLSTCYLRLPTGDITFSLLFKLVETGFLFYLHQSYSVKNKR